MTLEKLLIFGFALAALAAITTMGTGIFDARDTAEGQLQGDLDTLAGKGG